MEPTQAQQGAEGLQKALELADRYGVGTVLLFVFVAAFFVALWKGGAWLVQWMEKTHGTMEKTNLILEAIKGNHLFHIEMNTSESNKKLDAQTQILGLHTSKLDAIAEQTKKP